MVQILPWKYQRLKSHLLQIRDSISAAVSFYRISFLFPLFVLDFHIQYIDIEQARGYSGTYRLSGALLSVILSISPPLRSLAQWDRQSKDSHLKTKIGKFERSSPLSTNQLLNHYVNAPFYGGLDRRRGRFVVWGGQQAKSCVGYCAVTIHFGIFCEDWVYGFSSI